MESLASLQHNLPLSSLEPFGSAALLRSGRSGTSFPNPALSATALSATALSAADLSGASVSTAVPGSGMEISNAASSPFAGFVQEAIHQMDKLSSDAKKTARGLMVGDGTDIHTAMIASQKASLAFDLTLAVRNKAVGAYQQLMSMQF